MTWSATLTSKGQITLPKAVRDAFGLTAGSRVSFEIHGESATLRPTGSSVDAAFGVLRRSGAKAVTLKQMDAAIRRRAKGRR